MGWDRIRVGIVAWFWLGLGGEGFTCPTGRQKSTCPNASKNMAVSPHPIAEQSTAAQQHSSTTQISEQLLTRTSPYTLVVGVTPRSTTLHNTPIPTLCVPEQQMTCFEDSSMLLLVENQRGATATKRKQDGNKKNLGTFFLKKKREKKLIFQFFVLFLIGRILCFKREVLFPF